MLFSGSDRKMDKVARCVVQVFRGVLVGFGAIMPGISGGTLCVAFGMYQLLMALMSHPLRTIKSHWLKLLTFLIGVGIGFFGLAGLAGWLMSINELVVTTVFIGFILGTVPELWKDAGKQGRGKGAYIALSIGFTVMLALLLSLRLTNANAMRADLLGFLFCGLVWGISFIVPGLSSSTLLLYVGLYQPMLEGIARFDGSVLIPLGVGMLVCLVLLPRAVRWIYSRWHAVISHAILGIVLANTVTIFPLQAVDQPLDWLVALACIVGGTAASYLAGVACAKLEKGEE